MSTKFGLKTSAPEMFCFGCIMFESKTFQECLKIFFGFFFLVRHDDYKKFIKNVDLELLLE